MNRNYARLLMLGLLFAVTPARAENINIAAVVNESIITSADVAERRDLVLALSGMEPSAENQQRATPSILRSLIDESLQMEEAKRLSVTISDEDIAKALTATERKRGQAEGSTEAFLRKHGLSKRSLESQVRAMLSWQKVVQRKLRRNVSISEDEIARAQLTEAADPGISEVSLAVLKVPGKALSEEKAAALAMTLGEEISAGNSMTDVALKNAKEGITISPPRWVPEEKLPPGLQQTLRALKHGGVTPPLRTPEGYELLQLVDRRTTKPLPDTTEVVIREIHIPAPGTPSKDAVEKWRQQALAIRVNPGSCNDMTTGVKEADATVRFMRTQLGEMPAELRGIVTHLGVGEISDPLIQPREIAFIMLCERIEPATTQLADADKIRQKLFAEKLELEAAKRMRDLRRDAYIDIKGANAS